MDLLAEYRWILRISSTGQASVTSYGVEMLDANNLFLEYHAENVDLREDSEPLISPDPSGISLESDRWVGDSAFDFQDLSYASASQEVALYGSDTFFTF